jgi:hypothetical protein
MLEFKENRKNIPDEELLNDLKRVADKLQKKSLTFREYNEHGIFSSQNITARLGKWSEILLKAGLESRLTRDISVEDLFSNMSDVWAKLGRQPTFRDFSPPISNYSSLAYLRRFGTWNEALKAFINFINKTDVEVIPAEKAIRKRAVNKSPRNINWRLRAKILIRDSCICQMCGISPAKNPDIVLHVDHVKPWSKGGETVESNLQTLCHVCNIGKSNMEV